MIEIVCWNIGHLDEPWRELAHSGADVALLQEAKAPPADVGPYVEVDASWPWFTSGGNRPWRTAIAKLSDRVTVRPIESRAIDAAEADHLPVSRTGTLCAAEVTYGDPEQTITLVSLYGAWERPLDITRSGWIHADGSVHQLISDRCGLIGHQNRHRIIAAGDLNIPYGYGESGSRYWKARYDSVFQQMESVGLPLVGPLAPDGGLQADPWPAELLTDSRNVPTFRTNRNQPATAKRQLDFVFASECLWSRLRVQALNRPSERGSIDHCRIRIQLAE